jgi:DNA-directed RNA polymerase subunit RPC12/RpoP
MNDIESPKSGRTIYQCPDCGRRIIEEDGGKLSSFSSESEEASKNLLTSRRYETKHDKA